MYRIEMVMADRYGVIYHQNGSDAALPCYGPKLSLEVNQAGSLSFTVLKTHPLVDEMWPLSGYVRVIENGDEIFYGRILQRTENRLTGTIDIQCEGCLAFFLDSEIPPYGYDSNGNQITKTQTPKQFFIDAINSHNSEINNDWRRRFQIGEITAEECEDSCKYTISNYTQTKSAIQSNILDAHGGFLFTYPAENGYDHYIDWVEHSTRLNKQEITIGKNVEDFTHQFDSNELFTVIRPYYTNSKNKPQYLPEETLDLYDEDDYVNKYGRIVKTLEFKDATDEASLRSKAEAYIESMHKTLYGSISVQYIDMRYLDGRSPVVRLGDRFNNLVGLWGEEYMVSSMEIDMDHPENNTIQLDNPKTLKPNLTPEGEARSTNSTKSSISKKTNKSTEVAIKHITDLEDKMTIAVNELDIQVKNLNINVEGKFRETASEFERISSRVENVNGLVETDHHFIEGVNYKVETLEGTAVIQNSDFISNLAGKFEVWTGADGKVTVHLVDGADLSVDDVNGVTQSVGARLAQVIEDGLVIDTIEGSALWTQRDNITGVCGEYDIIVDPVTGKKTLVIKSGGGMKIRRNNVEYGIYDEGNLNGGLLVQKLADGTVSSTISGDIINLQTNNDYASLKLSNDGLQTTVSEHTTSINTMGVSIDAFEGSALWEQRDNITGVCGEYEVVTDTTTGEKTLVIKAGGGMKIRRNNVEYGLYDNGNLTGGIVVDKLRDGTVVTKIPGNIVDITATQMASIGVWTDSNKTSKAGLMIEAINGHTESTIDTDHLSFTGTRVNLSDKLKIRDDGGTSHVYLNDNRVFMGSGPGNLIQFIDGTISAFSYDYKDLATGEHGSMIKDASVSNNTLTITRFDGSTINFKKATSLIKTWGGTEGSPSSNSNTLSIVSDDAVPHSINDSVQVFLTRSDSWSGNTRTVYLTHTDSEIEHSIAKIDVDASSVVAAGKNAVKVSGPTWSTTPSSSITGNSNTATFTTDAPSPNSSAPKSLSLYLNSGSWSNNKKYVYVTHTNSNDANRIARIEVDASSIYTNGWVACYDTFDSSGTTATKELNYGEAAVVTVKQKNKDGSVITRLNRTYTAKTPSHSITGFETNAPSGAGTTTSDDGYIQNNSDGYYLSSNSRSATAIIVVKGEWYCDGVHKTANNYLKGVAGRLYRKGYDNGSSGASASHSISSFDTTDASTSETYNNLTNNSDGYYISGTGINATAYIVTKSTWKCDGESKSKLSYLQGATTNLYKEAFLRGWANYYDDPDWWEEPSSANGNKCYIPNRNRTGKVLWFTVSSSGSNHTSLGSGWYYTVTALSNGKYKHSFVLEMASNSYKGLQNGTNYTLYK